MKYLLLELSPYKVTATHMPSKRWAALTSDEELLYLSDDQHLWQYHLITKQHRRMSERRLISKKYLWKEGRVWGLNPQDELWSFDPATSDYRIEKKLHPQALWVSDVQNGSALIAQSISSKKEIVELSP